ncbi:hypothetical protein M2158_007934 [Streptomyces sp. SAI-144]|nr:hypothetical protein [Streptomyces sp. SAI-144]
MTGGKQGVRGSGRLQALVLDGQAVGKPVVVPARSGSGEEAAGSLENVSRLLGAADGDDQAGAGVLGDGVGYSSTQNSGSVCFIEPWWPAHDCRPGRAAWKLGRR